MGGTAGHKRTSVQPASVLLPTATSVEATALAKLPARDVAVYLLRYAARSPAGLCISVRVRVLLHSVSVRVLFL